MILHHITKEDVNDILKADKNNTVEIKYNMRKVNT